MKFIAYFSSAGVPKTGIAPTVSIWSVTGGLEVNAAAMTELAGGSYYYNFASYDGSKDYFIRADGGSDLSNNDRYVIASNELGRIETDITSIESFMGTGTTPWSYTVTNTVTSAVIPGVSVWVTSDIAGDTVIAQGVTNAVGQVNFMLNAGTVYVWRQLVGYTFANPDIEVVA